MKKKKSIYFDPIGIIENKEDFTRELVIYSEKENLDLYILKEGMEPEVEINGERYVGILEYPTLIRSDNSIIKSLSFVGNAFGYKVIALHPVE